MDVTVTAVTLLRVATELADLCAPLLELNMAVVALGVRMGADQGIGCPCRVIEGADQERFSRAQVACRAVSLRDLSLELGAVWVGVAVLADVRCPHELSYPGGRVDLVACHARNCCVSPRKRILFRMRRVPENGRPEMVPTVAVQALRVPFLELALVCVLVTALACVLGAQVARRLRVLITVLERKIARVALRALHLRVSAEQPKSGRHVLLCRDVLKRAFPVGRAFPVAVLATLKAGRVVRLLVAFDADLSPYLVEREGEVLALRGHVRGDVRNLVTALAGESLVASNKCKVLRMVKMNRRFETFLPVTLAAFGSQATGVAVGVTGATVLVKTQERLHARRALETRQREDFPPFGLVALLALEVRVLSLKLKLDVRVLECPRYLRTPGAEVHELKVGP